MKLKELDLKLKEIVFRHEKELPILNKEEEILSMLSRSSYASKNEKFKKEFDEAILNEIKGYNLSVNDKSKLKFLIKHHKTKYEYGFNFPGGIETYELLFGNQD